MAPSPSPSSASDAPRSPGAAQRPNDALDTLAVQNAAIRDLLAKWSDDTQRLVRAGDDVNNRWERGSAVKVLLQHLAVREEAKRRVDEALRAAGRDDLADQLEADGPGRREDIRALEEQVRGLQAINLNTPAADVAVARVRARLEREVEDEEDLLPAIAGALGESGERDLPSERSIHRHSVVRPNPQPRWYDRSGFLRAMRAWYGHLRTSPSGGTSPNVDTGREYQPPRAGAADGGNRGS